MAGPISSGINYGILGASARTVENGSIDRRNGAFNAVEVLNGKRQFVKDFSVGKTSKIDGGMSSVLLKSKIFNRIACAEKKTGCAKVYVRVLNK